ncbi:MAG: hypothetical protein COZ46_04015 [Verrucomicrobia bacterium CG_4_10_14_3_um_filter_43_23]|nr:MAG: hypothetical protein AUJ82_06890 [Verrucomicrobia bacterium CG1_02_43_26]PIP59884.1 MAG: hypothetical protein COX01_01420 [Verrucomicrobia bacterium CG22_combo_CG10-13_8_21_14_all_43_17]PIX58435.1 MAG: hypothetical protein COZ46_04015 [Verrucomicrobia bacterium CG_4_10_14_3_um_filter_43_23]PIY61582.1 MAG: hypothetical protein COY94_04730 [Verrucomicrobia bacterium CG_4_10_14_0_8_um_filter_43_34]PJA44005.1 MAG: hypothetical protein CO175_05165 [Verrucomicrobia bacterium CG_4_9_14_3_um_fi
MNLTKKQKQQIVEWVKEGNDVSSIQNLIHKNWEISLTHMDVRFIIDDLDLNLEDHAHKSVRAEDVEDHSGHTPIPFPGVSKEESMDVSGGVEITVDDVQRPGTILSGAVTFTDGNTCTWQLDELGRLGLIPPYTGYEPHQSDINHFQQLIQAELEKMGF